jgi:hypothetical protein
MNISLLRNSALVRHCRKIATKNSKCGEPHNFDDLCNVHVRRQGKKGVPLLVRKFISSFGGSSVKGFTNRDFFAYALWLTPPLPDLRYRHRARRSLRQHQATVAAMLWPHPTVHASIRRIPLALSGSSAWPSGGSARPLRLVLSSGSHRRDAAPGIGFDLVPRSPLNSVQSPQEAELMHHNGPSISGAHRRIKSANFADLVSGL